MGEVSQDLRIHYCFGFSKVCFFPWVFTFLLGPSPKSLQLLFFVIFFVFFQCLLWFAPWGPPQRISKYVFCLCFSSIRAFPKDRWLPWQWMSWSGGQNLTFVFGTFNLTCILLWLYFSIHIACFPWYLHSFWHMYISAYLNIIIAISLNGPWGRSMWGRWPYIHIFFPYTTYIYTHTRIHINKNKNMDICVNKEFFNSK